LGSFNSHLKDVLVAYADEALGDKRHEGILKALITEDNLAIEFKGRDVIFLKNYMRLMVTSNNDWVVPAGLEARRFFILDIGRGKIQDRAYFGKIVSQMESGGRAALLHYLLHFDLSQIDLTKFPRTEALKETKILSMSPVQKFWYARLGAGSLNVT